MHQDHAGEAFKALKRCLYIDHNFALGYFTLGNLYAARGDLRMARRQWANAAQMIAHLPAEQTLSLGEGLTVGEMLAAMKMPQEV
jgi:Tfp pilus assembly protein PilF